MNWLLMAFCTAFGLIIGSFVNVVIHRVPAGLSVVTPGSACPQCSASLAARDNIPVLSWVLLRGRCRHCQASISTRYPAVELLTGVLFAVLAGHFGLVWELPAYLYLAAIGVALAAIDLDVRRLPDALTLPSYPVAIVLLGVPALISGSSGAWLRGLAAGAALFLFYFLLVLIYPKGMGFGDVKLSGVLGIYLGYLGWGALIVGGFAGFALGGVVGGGLMLLGRAGRKTALPFGPFMLLATLVGILWGQALAGTYTGAILG